VARRLCANIEVEREQSRFCAKRKDLGQVFPLATPASRLISSTPPDAIPKLKASDVHRAKP